MNNQPARLEKQAELTEMDLFMNRFGPIILFFLIVMLLILIGVVIVAFIQMGTGGNITMVESGNYYYHLKDVI